MTSADARSDTLRRDASPGGLFGAERFPESPVEVSCAVVRNDEAAANPKGAASRRVSTLKDA